MLRVDKAKDMEKQYKDSLTKTTVTSTAPPKVNVTDFLSQFNLIDICHNKDNGPVGVHSCYATSPKKRSLIFYEILQLCFIKV